MLHPHTRINPIFGMFYNFNVRSKVFDLIRYYYERSWNEINEILSYQNHNYKQMFRTGIGNFCW